MKDISIVCCICFTVFCVTIALIISDKEKTKQTEIIYNNTLTNKLNRELVSQCGAMFDDINNTWKCTR